MNETQLLDVPAGQSILPALAKKEYQLEQRIKNAEAEAKNRIKESSRLGEEKLRTQTEEVLPAKEKEFLEKSLGEVKAKAESVRSEGKKRVEALKERGIQNADATGEFIKERVLGRG